MSTHSSKSKIESRRLERARAAERAEMFGSQDQILITQVVGAVMPSADGDMSVVGAAFQVAAEYIENNGTATQEIDLTWEINGHKFNAGFWPKRDNDASPQSAEEYGEPM